MTTFKDIESQKKIIKKIKKVGLSKGIIFSKEDCEKFNLSYDDEIDMSDAVIIKTINL